MGGGEELAEAQTQAKPRRGRLPATESKALRAQMLAVIRDHPSLQRDHTALADQIGVAESTVRRWLNEERKRYEESAAAKACRD